MAAVSDDAAQIMQQGGSVQQFSLVQTVSMQRSKLLEEWACQEADVVGVLFFVVAVARQIKNAEVPHVRDDRMPKTPP